MAKFRIEGPGGQAYEIEGPEGSTEQQAFEIFQRSYQPDAKKSPEYSWTGKGMADYSTDAAKVAVGQGLMLGFGDEAVAGLRSVMPGGPKYDDALAEERARVARFREHNPITAFGAEVVGGAALPVGLVARGAVQGATTLGTIGRGAALGGTLGAVQGFGSADPGKTSTMDNLAERATGAAVGGAAGTAVGAAVPAVIAAGRGAYQVARDAATPHVLQRTQGPEAAADWIMARNMQRAGVTPHAVQNDLTAGRDAARMGSNSDAPLTEMIADTSDSMQRLTGTMYRQGGQAGQIVRDGLEARQRGPANPYAPRAGEPMGQLGQVRETVSRAFQLHTADSARQTERRIVAEQRGTGNRLYAAAFRNADPYDIGREVTALALRAQQYPGGTVREGMERALNMMDPPQPTPGQRGRVSMPVTNLRVFDNAKKQLDAMIDEAERSNRPLYMELSRFKNELLRRVHAPDANGNPTRNVRYQEARNAWGTDAERRKALETGRQAANEGSEVTIEAFRDLTPGNQAMFRVGFLESLRNQLSRRRPGNDATLPFQEARMIELMREIIPQSRGKGVFSNRTERFGEVMRRQQRQVQTRQAAIGNSATAQRAQDDVRGAGDMLSAVLQAARGGTNWLLEAAVHGLNRLGGFNAETSAEIARRLVNTNPREQRVILARIRSRMGEAQFRLFTDELSRAAVAAGGVAGGEVGGAVGGAGAR